MNRKSVLPALLTIALLLPVACKKKEEAGQSVKDAMTQMCSAPDRVDPKTSADQKAVVLAKAMADGITNVEVTKLIASLATSKDKMAAVSAMAKKAGVGSCKLLDAWKKPAATGGDTEQHGSGKGGGAGGGGSDKGGNQDGKASGTTSAHGTGKGGGQGPGEKGGAAGNKDGTPGGASAEHGSGKGGGAGPGETGGAAGNKDGTPGGASTEHGSGAGGGAGGGGTGKAAGDKDGKQGK